MSINVTVTGNPIYLGGKRVFFSDIEIAKQNELLRRKKLRIQQVRQQSKDYAHSVRNKVTQQSNVLEKNEEEEKTENRNKCIQAQILSLQNECQNSILSVGAGHHLASIQKEFEDLEREKQDLNDAKAKARGVIAEERLKAAKCIQKEKSNVITNRIKKARQTENLRSMISNLPIAPSSIQQSKKPSSFKSISHRSEEEEEVEALCSNVNEKIVSPTKKFSQSMRHHPFTRSSLSPSRSMKRTGSIRQKIANHEDEDSCEDDSDDSDMTWPPRSARVSKEPLQATEPPRVRFYDHNSRVVKNSPRPSYSVVKMDPSEQPDMCEAIADEEEAVVRKENLNVLARREKLRRGSIALRKERGKIEAGEFLKKMKVINHKQKFQMAFNQTYPSDNHMDELRRKEKEVKIRTEMMKHLNSLENEIQHKAYHPNINIPRIDPEAPLKDKFDLSSDNEGFFVDIINKCMDERAKKQTTEFGNKSDQKNEEEEDFAQWIRHQRSLQNKPGPSGINNVPFKKDRAVSPIQYETTSNICACSSNKCTCCHQVNKNVQSESKKKENSVQQNSNIADNNHFVSKENEKVNMSDKKCEFQDVTVRENITEAKEISKNVSVQSSSSVTSSGAEVDLIPFHSSHSDTVESSLTYEGIKVTVKVSEKGKKTKKKERLSDESGPLTVDRNIQTSLEVIEECAKRNTTWNNHLSSTEATSSGSTAYMSPPSTLSPAHQMLLRSILTKIDAKNKNPKLHQYIKKVLDMSRNSIDNLPVSSVSDVSINSSIFEKSNSKVQKLINKSPKAYKYNTSCQANNNCTDDSSSREEAMKYAELAECLAHRVQDLAGMMDRINILPGSRTKDRSEDSTAYLELPQEALHSVRLSRSVLNENYHLQPPDNSENIDHCDLPSFHICPHPSASLPVQHCPPTSLNVQNRNLEKAIAHELSIIQEVGESQRPETPQQNVFDPDVSSIRGSPQQIEGRVSTGSSLCLLDDRDISSWLGSSSDDYEEVFRSLGIAWALPTIRTMRRSQRRTSGSQTSSRSTGRAQYSHSTPLGRSPNKHNYSNDHPQYSASRQSPRKPSTSSNSAQNQISVNSDSLTPPCISLNVPESVLSKRSR